MSIQPVHVAKSRRGQLAAFLAIFAMMLGATAWWTQSAEATFPAHSASITSEPGAGPVGVGSIQSYTFRLTLVNGTTSGAVAFRVTLPAGLVATAVSAPGFTCPVSNLADGALTGSECVSGAALTGAAGGTNYDIQIQALVSGNGGGDGVIDSFNATWVDTADGSSVTAATGTTATAISATAGPVSVSPAEATNAVGVAETFTFTLPAYVTCASDSDTGQNPLPATVNDGFVQCLSGDVNLTGPLTLLSGPTVTDADTSDATTVTVTVLNTRVNDVEQTGTGTVSLDLVTLRGGNLPADVLFESAVAIKHYVLAELRHVADVEWTNPVNANGLDAVYTGETLGSQDVQNNVRGSRHVVCTVVANTGMRGPSGGYIEEQPIQIPLTLPLTQITVVNSGGYPSVATIVVGPQTPAMTDTQIFVGNGLALNEKDGNGGIAGATCFSWVSTAAGDQEISVNYPNADGVHSVHVDWDTDANGNNEPGGVRVNRALIKEWNVLEDSLVTLSGVAVGQASGNDAVNPIISKTIPLVLNPATGQYSFGSLTSYLGISDIFRGSHVNRANQVVGPIALAGVKWTARLDGCGVIGDLRYPNIPSLEGPFYGTTTLLPDGSVGNYPQIGFLPQRVDLNPVPDQFGAADCVPGSTATITFTGSEPGPLGSGNGLTVTEKVVLTFSQQIAAKQVLLAWAGQRIILEHDWRIPAGDYSNGVSAGVCPWANFPTPPFEWVKGGGPGNFIPALGVSVLGNDDAWLGESLVPSSSQAATMPEWPQWPCITRVLFESEQPGQVDIEHFIDPDYLFEGHYEWPANVTKVAFVIYYMKFESVTLTLAKSGDSFVTKGAMHNSPVLTDWTPSNPWNTATDVKAADRNVSIDVLIRGRVKGWFLNENPSGRERDASDPLNVLPADRWVMPDDWALLAGGPKDPADGTDAIGTAESFRPYYDLMFAPNNAKGLALRDPRGLTGQVIGTVTTNAYLTNTAATFAVTSNTGITAGTPVIVRVNGIDYLTTASACTILNAPGGAIVGLCITVAPFLPVTPPAGSQIILATSVPFEGPLSLIDIPGFAAFNGGVAGAAVSNLPGGFGVSVTRDTTQADGDVDMWDAPMPSTPVSLKIRGTGFIKQVMKSSVYYTGVMDNPAQQLYPNPYYVTEIPESPFIPAVSVGGGFLWDSWGNDGPQSFFCFASYTTIGCPGSVNAGDGPYYFWTAKNVAATTGNLTVPGHAGKNSAGIGEALGATDLVTLHTIRLAYGDSSISRDFFVFSDNHGEFMAAANGDFKTDLTACTTNTLGGGKHCKPGDVVGKGTLTATADYPDFRGKHFPVASNDVVITWTWGGYKDVTIENDPAGNTQFKYVVFHAMDRDGFCRPTPGTGMVLLHPVLSSEDEKNAIYPYDPVENVDFAIDSGEGIIISGAGAGTVNDGRRFAYGVRTFSTANNVEASTGVHNFPLSSLAASGATDECQAYVKVSNSLLGILNILVIAHDDEGDIGFDRIIDLQGTMTYTLNFRWSLITWNGADNIPVGNALAGTGANEAGNDISDQVTAVYGWDAAAQDWLGYFPSGVNVPGANDLVSLDTGAAYWIAIKGPSSVTWTIATHVDR